MLGFTLSASARVVWFSALYPWLLAGAAPLAFLLPQYCPAFPWRGWESQSDGACSWWDCSGGSYRSSLYTYMTGYLYKGVYYFILMMMMMMHIILRCNDGMTRLPLRGHILLHPGSQSSFSSPRRTCVHTPLSPGGLASLMLMMMILTNTMVMMLTNTMGYGIMSGNAFPSWHGWGWFWPTHRAGSSSQGQVGIRNEFDMWSGCNDLSLVQSTTLFTISETTTKICPEAYSASAIAHIP